jgi:hypothetical protein
MSQTKISFSEIESLKNQHNLKSLHIIKFNDPILTTQLGEGIGEHNEENPDFDDEYPSLDFAFKKVGFDLLSASAAMGQDNPVKAIKMQMEACLVFGDKEFLFDKNDSTIFTSVMQKFVEITKSRSASLKKN